MSEYDDIGGATGPATITPTMIDHLRRTRPWVVFASVLGFIVVGLLLLGSVAVLGIGLLSREFGSVVGVLAATLYLAIAGVYFFLALLLTQYGTAIGRLVATADPRFMEESLDRQRRFWKSLGIVAIAMMVVYAVIMIVMVIAGIGAALLTT